MSSQRLLLLPVVLLAACGGGTSPVAPPSPPLPSYTVVVTVFYDENGNGTADAAEVGRVPGVEVEIAGHTGRSDRANGRAVIEGVPQGSHPVTVRAASLPPFYDRVASATVMAQSPQTAGTDVFFPLTLTIGRNRPNVYMAFGDSITDGDGARTTEGYRDVLQEQLQQYFNRGTVVNEAIAGTRSDRGADRIGESLMHSRPAYSLILYGTNDWNRLECKVEFPCFTVSSLRAMIASARALESLPVIATIIPINPGDAQAPERNEWVARMNDLIRPMVRQERAVLADLHAAFLKDPDARQLFSDRLHPNDQGYRVIAAEYFRAITTPTSLSGMSTARPPLLLAPRVEGAVPR
jgi:lysophospholipase L1-like esterase